MNKLTLLMLPVLLLVGCGEGSHYPILSDYKCNKEQLVLVKEEVNICKDTDYFLSYCFSHAKKSLCTSIVSLNKSDE